MNPDGVQGPGPAVAEAKPLPFLPLGFVGPGSPLSTEAGLS